MKISKIITLFLIAATGISLLFFIKNENAKLVNARNESSGNMETYDPDMWEMGGVQRMSEAHFQEIKHGKRIQILSIGISCIIGLSIISYFVKSNEDKLDPLKNLDSLKEKNIIDESEYLNKKEELIKIQASQKEKLLKEKRDNILVRELENLKSNGLLTEDEFQEKLSKIKSIDI